MFECAIRDRIVVDQSKCVISDGMANWTLVKETPGLWNSLQSDSMG